MGTCQMPVMDGYAATKEIRAREQDRAGGTRTPIVAVTANAMREDYDRCRDAGMDDFVAKPVTLAALANAIERAVAASRAGLDAEGSADQRPTAPSSREVSRLGDQGVDRAALAALQEDVGCAASLARMTPFLEQLEPQADQIRDAAAQGEYETVARIAHRMKSSSATLGAVSLAEVLEEIEASAGGADLAGWSRLRARLELEVANARGAFEGVMEGLEAAN